MRQGWFPKSSTDKALQDGPFLSSLMISLLREDTLAQGSSHGKAKRGLAAILAQGISTHSSHHGCPRASHPPCAPAEVQYPENSLSALHRQPKEVSLPTLACHAPILLLPQQEETLS